jgi:SNF2 family DNA or RNA helicase
MTKLRQITSGFILVDGEPVALRNSGPRLAALDDIIECCEGPVIVFAAFTEEIAQIGNLLKEKKGGVREYYGATKRADRAKAIDDFQSGAARFFIANPAAAGTGLTLTAARTVIYYSNSFSLVERSQSEDRAHRVGTKHPVVYIDLVARDTIDERIAMALQTKSLTAQAVMKNL